MSSKLRTAAGGQTNAHDGMVFDELVVVNVTDPNNLSQAEQNDTHDIDVAKFDAILFLYKSNHYKYSPLL